MHRLATLPGGWTPSQEGVIFVEQQPAPIVILTAADTDIQTLAAAVVSLPKNFPALRVVNLLQLQQQLTIDTYAEDVLAQAKVILVRLIGGQSYWSYGLEVVKAIAQQTGAALLVIPGDEHPDPSLMSHSTVGLAIANQVWRYCIEAGVENYQNLLRFLAVKFLDYEADYQPPQSVPRIGLYPHPKQDLNSGVGILFYRAHYLSGNTAVINALCQALIERQLRPVPIFVSSLKDPDVQAELIDYCRQDVEVLLNTTSFALASLETDTPQVGLWETLNVPVLQVILSSSTQETWTNGTQGLTPRDMAMNVALPEVDGRIITRAVSFKAVQTQNAQLQTDVVVYEPERSRINFVAELAARWVKLRQTPASERKIALILANYPNRDGRLANGVGLDTPASCVEILKTLKTAGYTVGEIPENSDVLMQLLTSGITNDPEGWELRQINQSLSLEKYKIHFQSLPSPVQNGIETRWGSPEERLDQTQGLCIGPLNPPSLGDFDAACAEKERFPIAGIQFGNVFVGIQPARGYDLDPTLNYHAPDLEPPHPYLAFYHWVNSQFGADAVVHVGKHGNLEWLPGKSIALSENCYPEAVFGATPHFYPFIVNDPGEGAQAKRRSQAVILDHLTPPMTRAELYGSLHQLEGLIDEYYEAQTLDPARVDLIRDRLLQLIRQENLQKELGLETELLDDSALAAVLTSADGYLCELKEAQIRDGLHIFGQCPEGRLLRDLVMAIARNPNAKRLGLTRAIAQDWNLDVDPLTANLGDPLEMTHHPKLQDCRIIGDAVEQMENHGASLVEALINGSPSQFFGEQTQKELAWVGDRLLPDLRQTHQELSNLLHGLDGQYVPSGASGAPTRGRPEVLPTGRNFYSVDIRAIPTETAWELGRKAAEVLVERYTQDYGEYPRTLGLSVWGTSTMRTGGDDLAEALALLGVQPIWDGISRRVIDFEILPLSILGRPRVDVTLRISGFFRDAFPNLIDLFDSAVNAVANLPEPPDQNPLAAQSQQEMARWQSEGIEKEEARVRSRYRIFGSKPSAYGAGLQGLIESQNWDSDADLARAYINWSAYAYTSNTEGKSAPEAFTQRLGTLQVVLQNQDNREHDLLDSDDYYQFQGGLSTAVKSISGQQPEIYFGDNSRIDNPKVKKLSEEIARVYRSRVVNPKWIAGVMRHGYKGAFEMAATVDYLFAYDATTHCVEDFMYEGVAQAYLFNPEVQNFIQSNNPWALRDMAERFLEANQRGLWKQAAPEMLEGLRAIVHEAEGMIESKFL
jgi:cobaltochelatase CobN